MHVLNPKTYEMITVEEAEKLIAAGVLSREDIYGKPEPVVNETGKKKKK